MPFYTAYQDGYIDSMMMITGTCDADIDNEQLCVCPDKEAPAYFSLPSCYINSTVAI